MLNILKHFRLLEERNQEQSQILIKGDNQNPSKTLVYLANEFVDEMREVYSPDFSLDGFSDIKIQLILKNILFIRFLHLKFGKNWN